MSKDRHKDLDPRDLDAIFARSPEPVLVAEPVMRSGKLADLRVVACNPAMTRIAKLRRRGFGPGTLIAGIAQEDWSAIRETVSRVIASGRPRTIKLYLEAADSWSRCTFALSRSGKIVAMFGGFFEKGQGGKRKEETGDSSLFGDFFQSVGIKLILRPSDGHILEVNRAAEEFYGWKTEELKSMRIFQIDESPAPAIREIFKAIDTRGFLIFTTCHRVAKGEPRFVEVHAYSGRYRDEAVHFAMVAARSEPVCLPISEEDLEAAERNHPAGERDFAPFAERYERRLPYIGDLVRQMLPYGRLIAYKRGEHFLEYGEVNPNVGFVLRGAFRQYTIGPEGEDCTLEILRPGRILYVDARMGGDAPLHLAQEAMTECLVFVVNSRYLGPVIDKDMRWSKLFYIASIEIIERQFVREYSLLCENATERLRRFAAEEGDAFGFLHSYQVASYLGMTSETLSRIRKSLGSALGKDGYGKSDHRP